MSENALEGRPSHQVIIRRTPSTTHKTMTRRKRPRSKATREPVVCAIRPRVTFMKSEVPRSCGFLRMRAAHLPAI